MALEIIRQGRFEELRDVLDIVWYRKVSGKIFAILRFWDEAQERHQYHAVEGNEVGPPYPHFCREPEPVTDGDVLAYVVGEQPAFAWRVVGPSGSGPAMHYVSWMTVYRGEPLYCATRPAPSYRQVLCYGLGEVCELPCDCRYEPILAMDRLTMRGRKGLGCLVPVDEHLLVIEDLRPRVGIHSLPTKGPYR